MEGLSAPQTSAARECLHSRSRSQMSCQSLETEQPYARALAYGSEGIAAGQTIVIDRGNSFRKLGGVAMLLEGALCLHLPPLPTATACRWLDVGSRSHSSSAKFPCPIHVIPQSSHAQSQPPNGHGFTSAGRTPRRKPQKLHVPTRLTKKRRAT